MGKYFDELHAGPDSQLGCAPCTISDTSQISALRALPPEPQTLLTLASLLGRQLRYREAVQILRQALACTPEHTQTLRLLGGRLLSTLQYQEAKTVLLRCRADADMVDLSYRLGLCCYYAGEYRGAAEWFSACHAAADEEMGIAAIYWHTLCARRGSFAPALLALYRPDMAVGHHTGYETAARVWAGLSSPDALAVALRRETDDMEFAIRAYSLSLFLRVQGQTPESEQLLEEIVRRDGFWPCYAYIAAWNDLHTKSE